MHDIPAEGIYRTLCCRCVVDNERSNSHTIGGRGGRNKLSPNAATRVNYLLNPKLKEIEGGMGTNFYPVRISCNSVHPRIGVRH